ncbi:MAG: prepilin-type cleavage/methylation domain-containing protein, partial [Finegoldia magna]|nr:prepilin-type cleavage/methylation domain-containing protein [Finegoldia magna]
YIKNEIERSRSVITEKPNWTHFDQSMGFVLVKYIDDKQNYVYFTKENGKIIRYAFTDPSSFDELKEHGPNGRITQNKLKDNADDFTFSHDDNYIYLKENGKKLVAYIGDKVK